MENLIRKLYAEASAPCDLRCHLCFRRSRVGERFGDLDPAALARVMDDPAISDMARAEGLACIFASRGTAKIKGSTSVCTGR